MPVTAPFPHPGEPGPDRTYEDSYYPLRETHDGNPFYDRDLIQAAHRGLRRGTYLVLRVDDLRGSTQVVRVTDTVPHINGVGEGGVLVSAIDPARIVHAAVLIG